MKQKDIEKSALALLNAGKLPQHERPKKPTKEDLARKFAMKADGKGKPSIREVK